MGHTMETELLRHVMSIKDDITDIKIQIRNFEINHETFKHCLGEIEKKVQEIEVNLKINSIGVAEIEKREVFYRRIKRRINDYIINPFVEALQKGWFYLVVMSCAVILTWFLILIGFDVDNLNIREILR